MPEYLEKEELVALLRAAKEYSSVQGYSILFTLAHTGLRIGELLTLKTSDIDWTNRRINITKTLYAPTFIHSQSRHWRFGNTCIRNARSVEKRI
ncbi:tyrosine-type recombinase/integrase [Paenibacillus tyrfis]|uniref:tyrosine-type recombinase/integrase n=1 Tax=Paenibacillus tyrfis TaxID=1501230 RepID=UPI0035CD3D05